MTGKILSWVQDDGASIFTKNKEAKLVFSFTKKRFYSHHNIPMNRLCESILFTFTTHNHRAVRIKYGPFLRQPLSCNWEQCGVLRYFNCIWREKKLDYPNTTNGWIEFIMFFHDKLFSLQKSLLRISGNEYCTQQPSSCFQKHLS